MIKLLNLRNFILLILTQDQRFENTVKPNNEQSIYQMLQLYLSADGITKRKAMHSKPKLSSFSQYLQ